jgi:hypothetical protein
MHPALSQLPYIGRADMHAAILDRLSVEWVEENTHQVDAEIASELIPFWHQGARNSLLARRPGAA